MIVILRCNSQNDSTMLVSDSTMYKKCEIESDTNLEMPKVSQELLGFRILNFEPESEICHKFKEFILFGDILWQKCRVVSKVMQ